MNRQTLLFPLSVKFLFGVAVAAILPMAVLVGLTWQNYLQISIEQFSAYVYENGLRRESAITKGLTEAQRVVEAYLNDNVLRSVLASALRVRSGTSAASDRTLQQIELRAMEQLRENILNTPTPLFESAWLLTPSGRIVAPVAGIGYSLPFASDALSDINSEIYTIAQTLASVGAQRALITTERSGMPSIELLHLIYSNQNELVGFFVGIIATQEVIYNNLRQNDDDFGAYSFLVLADGSTIFQLPETAAANRVNINTVGVKRALNVGRGVETYTTGFGDQARTVIGYYSTIQVLDTRFAFITELDESVIEARRNAYIEQTAFPVLLGMVALLVVISLLMAQIVAPPLAQLGDAMRGMIAGNFDVPLTIDKRSDEVGALAATFIDMRARINRLLQDMNRRLEERNRDVRLAQDISHATVVERNLQALMDKAVNLIVENFPTIYHAQIFLIDERGEFAVLRASTGEAGAQLLKRGHRLAVGSVSVIGQVTEQGEIVIARDISASNVHRQNEFLKETQAELAIPLRLGREIIGALDVQSKERDSFTPDQISALQTLADQITIAIENARLYEESKRLLRSVEQEREARTVAAWQAYFQNQRAPMLSSRYGNPTGYDGEPLRNAAMKSGEVVVGDKTAHNTVPFAVPIKWRGQVLGVVEYELVASDFNYNKVLLAEELVNRLAVSLDNARLFQDSQKATERERLVNAISARLTSQTDVQDIVAIALQEVSQALKTPKVAIRFHLSEQNGQAANGNGNGNAPHDSDATTSL